MNEAQLHTIACLLKVRLNSIFVTNIVSMVIIDAHDGANPRSDHSQVRRERQADLADTGRRPQSTNVQLSGGQRSSQTSCCV